MPLENVVLNVQSMQRKRWRGPWPSYLLPLEEQQFGEKWSANSFWNQVQPLYWKEYTERSRFSLPCMNFLTWEEQIPNFYSYGVLKKHVCWSTHQNQLQDMQALRNSKLNIQHYFSAFSNAFKREPEKFCLLLTQAPHETTFSRTVLPCLLTTE